MSDISSKELLDDIINTLNRAAIGSPRGGAWAYIEHPRMWKESSVLREIYGFSEKDIDDAMHRQDGFIGNSNGTDCFVRMPL